MERPPRLLLLAAADAAPLAAALLESIGEVGEAVASAGAFAEALGRGGWDVVVASATAAPPAEVLAAVADAQPGLPVVVVAGAEADLEALAEAGAAAVLTAADARLVGAAVARALRGARPAPPAAPAPPMPLIAAASDAHALFSPDASAVQALAEHLPIGLYQSTPDGRILFANEALPAVLGLDSVEALGRLDVRRDLGYPREHFVAELRHHGEVRNLVVQWADRAGRPKYTRENARAVHDAEGNVRYYEGTIEDVTAEYEARAQEQRRTERLGALVRFATAADAATTAGEVYAAAVEAVAATMGTPLVMLLARLGDETRSVAWSEALPDGAVALFNDLHVGALLPLHTQPILLRDERTSANVLLPEAVRAMMREHGVRSVGSFPLIHHGRAHGAFVALYAEPHTFTDEELQVAETLAWHVAGSLARQRAESGLRDSEACLRFLAENTSHVLYRRRYPAAPGSNGGPGAGDFDYLSPAVEALTGFAPDALEALGGLDALVEEREVLQGGGLLGAAGSEDAGRSPSGAEGHHLALYRIRTRDGETRWVEDSAYPWRDAAGAAVGLVGVLQDVTERKRREEEQAAEAARVLCQQKALVALGGLHDVAPEAVIRRAVELVVECTGAARAAVWLRDADGSGRCLDAFVAAEAGHQRGGVLAPHQFGPWLAEVGARRSLAIADAEADPRSTRYGTAEHLRRLGARAALAAPIRRHGRAVGVVSLHDAAPRAWNAGEQDFAAAVADLIALAYERAERRAAEAARQESEGRYRAISELASDYAFALHFGAGGGRLAWATDAFARVSGYAASDIRRLRDLLAIVHPESREAALGVLRHLKEGEDAELELRIVTKDGEDRWVRHCARRTVHAPTGEVVIYHSGQDVTERKQFERELIAAREEAEDHARLKSAFLANMSHEIRTPLTGILGYAGLLAEEVEGEHREFVEFIERSGRRLLDTLNSVLELARLEASGVEPNLELLDVAAEAHQAVRLLAPLAEAKGLALTLARPGAGAGACLDRVCLGRILTNLIGNAIKFTDEGGVYVAVEVDADDVLVRVRDTGCGIAPEFLPHLFDEFKQESEGHARSHEGAGLGLAITKRLTDLLGGAITVESARPGGTTFVVAFPHYLAEASGDGSDAARAVGPPLIRPSAPAPADAPAEGRSGAEAPMEDVPWEDAARVEPEDEGGEGVARRYALGEPFDDAAEVHLAVPEGALPGPSAGGTVGLAASPADEEAGSLLLDDDDFPDGVYVTAEHSEALAPDDLIMAARVPSHGGDAAPAEAADPRPIHAPTAPYELRSAAPEPDPEPDPDPVRPASVPPQPDLAPMDYPPLPPEAPRSDAAPDPLTADRDPEAGAPAAPDDREEALVAVGPAVLVVEDNEDTRALLERLLQRTYRVCAVPDALSALDRMSRERFDALLLDINLGGKQTGIDVLRIARTIPGYEDVFAVALTAYALPGDRERFLEAGFDRYVSKPFTRATLMEALNEGMPAA